ncbi:MULTISPECIES: sigma-54-dependent Fis family transcriptional regulator [Pseudomonas]|jgi:transcriptional regulator of acetoin/glycerol metabolism|uniref:Transcriptional regulator of acetoin/glycerol metabolism n=2 Tax=Pseudomonas fluorescens TaxID=294 RepID=A0ABY1T7X6_PSEFL|nr:MULTISPECIES: sigma-54-dependent Fis family transcriptional regulator [Pseudomonas]MEA3170364.1 sigma-54 dependent transcriptional regulator, acetoin dehydrogenase operon transcriptional [Pseudomonas sp.]MBC8785689.1 sigma-54-dependent Fis family transcriptional regulator [Pseudomonas fluorescens]MCI4603031.1 sigma-54-dependent Fis family transcriptional regulator [Pseudomonas fluorescens]MDD5441969.1 sigma-54-dependent Fis family transcriptional regulator [Pseudomonas fluorescens]OEC73352.
MHNDHFSRHAQQVLTVTRGQDLAQGPGSDPSIARSWLRCLEDYHLDPALSIAPTVLEHGRLLESRERLQQVLSIAGSEMNSLHQQLSGAGHAVLLTDARGVILNCVTAPSERKIFERAGLWLGADWSEACEGTNGIGTCLVERQSLTIHRDEHFRGRHTGLTCSASPVFDPQGELLAVLDVSSAREAVSRQSQFHTMALVNLSAKMIESCYFLRHFENHWLLRFHLQAESVGLFSEGLLAFDGEGRICAVNQSALNLLGQARGGLLGQPVEAFFECTLDQLLGRASANATASWPLRTRDGRSLFAVLRGQARRAPPLMAKPEAPRLPGICLGDPALQSDFNKALRVFERDVPLLINGETGCGKEAFAKAVHQASSRANNAFVALNCAAIPENLIESELFGYRGGSFTGALKEGMRGKLQQADGGTLFLDEIGDMPFALQTRLLRVLEDRVVVPIGGAPQAVDVRIISATHRDLLARVANGSFREDLYYRLNGLEIAVPPLRERSDKAQLLAFLLAEEAAGQVVLLDEKARHALLDYAWPGNVRQLRNVLRTLAALCENGRIRLDDLPPLIRQARAAMVVEPRQGGALDDAERVVLLNALKQQHWHMSHAAESLGVSRNTLYRKLRKHGIERCPQV